MYSLPITTYSDYWRRTKQWSSYLGGLAVFAAGTRYSTFKVPDIPQIMQMHSLQGTSVASLNIHGQGVNWGLANRRPLGEKLVSRGISNLGLNNQEFTDQEGVKQKASSKDSSDQGIPNEGAEHKTTTTTTNITVLEKGIPFETQYVESETLLPGMSQTQEKGEVGVLRQVIKTFEVDGQPVDQQVKSSYELKSPKKEIIIQNSKPIPPKKIIVQTPKPGNIESQPIDLTNFKISKTFNVEATAYTYTGSNTATGVPPREGLIAVDPKIIAMGSKVYVEGYGYAIAADTGGAILGNRIDVFFGTLRQCIDWGRKPVRIHILNPI
ncbi:Cell wall-binding protein [Desulfosporosinus sp. I2]|uniref:G5 and 3D domain-containing protein n=1 Tax=Desulfosporosinus sp. I2 TaxID=1617025 RepID=UPI0005EFBAE8|nr:3D domain-containing protein [Desulfosporosinus sp. I2]KJR47186.1 Cell wall-binding protein [Desulfosporosinus sp. I2]